MFSVEAGAWCHSNLNREDVYNNLVIVEGKGKYHQKINVCADLYLQKAHLKLIRKNCQKCFVCCHYTQQLQKRMYMLEFNF